MGLYSQQTQKRLALNGTEVSRREYSVARIRVASQAENILLVAKEGWHPAEVAADNAMSEWKWTAKRAVLSFRNPKKDATIYVEYDARVDQFNPPQQVTVSSAAGLIGSFSADSPSKKMVRLPILAAQFGTEDTSVLVLEVDKAFKPGN